MSETWVDIDLETGEPKPTKNQKPEPIPEIGCPECLRYFGWSTCRKGQYKRVVLMGDFMGGTISYVVCAVLDGGDLYQKLGYATHHDEGCEMVKHLAV
jgi:hypothetical protein